MMRLASAVFVGLDRQQGSGDGVAGLRPDLP